jgi:hypothetical protein
MPCQGVLASSVAYGAQCTAPAKDSDLQATTSCTNALCCPRELNMQVNLVRAIAAKLKSQGYSIADQADPIDKSPDITGFYRPDRPSALRTALRNYKTKRKLRIPGDDLTYQLVNSILTTNLFTRWTER